MYTFYTIPGTCSSGIVVLMEKLGLDYELIKRDDVENYTDIVPTNQVPALKTEDGTVIAEGAAIALYLLEKHDNDMLPDNLEKRAEFYQWLNFDYSTLHPAYGKLFGAQFKYEGLDDDTKQKLIDQCAKQVSNYWAILDKRLADRKFICGDKPCHADYMVAVYSTWNERFPTADIKLGDNIKRMIKDVMSLPEFKSAYEKENVELKMAA
tara:strand:+ start:65 stop:691 length:627 start_codon:yes stop_codon:yes gene_type:complete